MSRAKPIHIMERARSRRIEGPVSDFLQAPVKTPEDHARECAMIARSQPHTQA